MKSILIITSFLPYPIHSGGEQAQFNMIEALKGNYKIGIVFPVNRDNRPEDVKALSNIWPEVRMFPFPWWKQYTYLPFLAQKARKFINRHLSSFWKKSKADDVLGETDFLVSKSYLRFVRRATMAMKADVIQVEFIQNLNIGKYLPEGIKKIFVHHEIGFVITDRSLEKMSLTERQQARRERKKHQEIARLNQYDGIVTLTETDKDVLENAGVTRPIFVSPAAVNTKEMAYEGWSGNLVFIGGYHHRPNQEGIDWFLSEVVPRIDWKHYPQARLKMIGLGWPLSYERDFNGLHVQLLGYVDDLSEHAACGIMIVPILTGSGMRMKILDAAALSVPFVSTNVGVEGLDFADRNSCLIGDCAEEFAQALVTLMNDGILRKTIAINSHRLFLEKYSLHALVGKREVVYKAIT